MGLQSKKTLNAYVMTLFKNKDGEFTYLDPALICGQSVAKWSDFDRVCLVEKPCPKEIQDLLLTAYTQVIEIDLIYPHPSWYGYDLVYPTGHPFTRVFSKFRAFNLTQYDRILLLDLDFICLANIDDLFDLEAPAMTFERIEITHGDIVPADKCDFTQRTYATGNAGVILWKPNRKEYLEILDELSQPAQITKNLYLNQAMGLFTNLPEIVDFYVFPEQDYLTVKYNGKIRYISYTYGSNDYDPKRTKGFHIYGDVKRWFWQVDNGGICKTARRDFSTDLFQKACVDYLESIPNTPYLSSLIQKYFLKHLQVCDIRHRILPFRDLDPGPLQSPYLNRLLRLFQNPTQTLIARGKDWELHSTSSGYYLISEDSIRGRFNGTRIEAYLWASLRDNKL